MWPVSALQGMSKRMRLGRPVWTKSKQSALEPRITAVNCFVAERLTHRPAKNRRRAFQDAWSEWRRLPPVEKALPSVLSR